MTQEEFLAIFDQYRPMVYALALSYTRSPQDAEDVCQTAFLRLLERPPAPGKEKPWLAQVTVNECRSLLRAPWRKRRAELEEGALESLSFEQRSEGALWAALESLARRCQDGQEEAIPMRKRAGFLRGAAAAAACLALAVCAGAWLLHTGRDTPEVRTTELPRLPLSAEVTEPNGMGFEGYMAFDISELVNANPWTEGMKLPTLPVYRNLAPLDPAGAPKVTPDPARSREALLETAALLGLDPGDVEIDENPEFGEGCLARAEGIELRAWGDQTATIAFDPAVSLPEGYEFSHSATYEELADVAEYLKVRYRDLMAMDDPQVNISGGDYTFYADQMYSLEFFDAGDSPVDALLNYNFRRAAFYGGDRSGLTIIRLYSTDLSEKVGDYPIITPKAAQKLLLEGRYITNVPYELPGRQYVKKVELLYLTGGREEYFMPYYRFLAELPEAARENGLNTYGAYYVPAVEEAYLTGLPVWDGRFN